MLSVLNLLLEAVENKDTLQTLLVKSFRADALTVAPISVSMQFPFISFVGLNSFCLVGR